jgi:hypothetical protein
MRPRKRPIAFLDFGDTFLATNDTASWFCIAHHWSPKVVGERNGQQVKLVKFH